MQKKINTIATKQKVTFASALMIHPGLLLQDRYQVLQILGKGGFGQTFEVDDRGASKVLKVLNLARFQNSETKKKAVSLFQREAAVMSRLQHPGIPIVEPDGYFTFAEATGEILHCLVMEKIEGENLQDWVEKNGPVSQKQALHWLKQLLDILDYFHQHQYFHRDIKPANIMLRPDGQLVLIDFGTVREITQTYIVKIGGKEEITCVWSAGYTPEEAIHGKAVPQSDFYALGRTFVYLLTGKSPLELAEESGQLNWRGSAPQLSSLLADWIDYLMAPSPLMRPPNTSFILKCLEGKTIETLPSPPIENLPSRPIEPPSPPTTRLLIILNFVLFSIVLVSGLLWFQRQQENQWQVPRKENSQIRNY